MGVSKEYDVYLLHIKTDAKNFCIYVYFFDIIIYG